MSTPMKKSNKELIWNKWLFSPGTPVSSTNQTDCHDITEILLKVALSTITPNPLQCMDDIAKYARYAGICHTFPCLSPPYVICIWYLDVNWLIPKISACQARIWSVLASKRSERVTNFIFCRTGWYCSVSIIFTFSWHIHHPYINNKHGYIYICIFAGKIT